VVVICEHKHIYILGDIQDITGNLMSFSCTLDGLDAGYAKKNLFKTRGSGEKMNIQVVF
jgi:hypothetical protein